jgi:DNA-binding SARP family transcriptional activator
MPELAPAIAASGAPAVFEIDLLGLPRAFRVEDGVRREVSIRLRRAWRGLALLALAAEQRVGRTEVVRTLWRDASPARVRRNLAPTVYALRRALGANHAGRAAVLSGDGWYGLDPDSEWRVDALRFGALLADGKRAVERQDESAALATWTRALELYRGPLLLGDDDPWVEERRELLRDRRLELLRLLGELRAKHEDLEGALDAFRLSLTEEPLQEEVHVALLRVYARLGRRDLVRRHFDRFSRLLADELGVEPSLATTLEYHRLMAGAEA